MQQQQVYRLYDGEVVLVFDPIRHRYKANGKPVVGVTSVIGVIDKSGPLINWAVNKVCIPFLREKIKPGETYDEVELVNLFNNAGKQHTIKTQQAADVGTLGHKWIEAYIKYQINRQRKGEEPYPEYKEYPPAPQNQVLKNLVQAFLTWESSHKVTFHESERKVYSKKHNYAGTLDVEATVDKELCILDVKTSNRIYHEHRFQVAAYMNARIEELRKSYKAYWIVRLGKDKLIDEKGGELADFEAIRYSKTDFKADIGAFLGALKVYNRLQELRRNHEKG